MHVLADGTQMQWGKYEVFSVLSAVVLGIGACMPGIRTKDRLWAAVGAVVLVALAYQSGHATSGTFTFPVQIFFIPPVAGAWLIYKGMASLSGKNQASTAARTEAIAARSTAARAERPMTLTSIPTHVTPPAPPNAAASTGPAPTPLVVAQARLTPNARHAAGASPHAPPAAASLASHGDDLGTGPAEALPVWQGAVGCSNSTCVQHGTTTSSKFCTSCGAPTAAVPSL